jgi:hypothetical protein
MIHCDDRAVVERRFVSISVRRKQRNLKMGRHRTRFSPAFPFPPTYRATAPFLLDLEGARPRDLGAYQRRPLTQRQKKRTSRHVSDGSKTEVGSRLSLVRSSLNSGHAATTLACHFVPTADVPSHTSEAAVGLGRVKSRKTLDCVRISNSFKTAGILIPAIVSDIVQPSTSLKAPITVRITLPARLNSQAANTTRPTTAA